MGTRNTKHRLKWASGHAGLVNQGGAVAKFKNSSAMPPSFGNEMNILKVDTPLDNLLSKHVPWFSLLEKQITIVI